MIATPCPPPSSLRSLSSGRLAETESDALFDHIDQCDTCREELQSIQEDPDWLIDALRSPAPTSLSNYEQEHGYRAALARALGAIEHIDSGLQDSPSTPHLPKQIGEYEIIRPLGRGGMGHVYLARHTKLGRDVALKLIASHRLDSPQAATRFEAEMRAVGKLTHPNIVAAHDAREVDGTALLITEYIDGLDLAEIVRRTGPLSVADACEIARTIALALDYISQQGFVHRDVKPSNIMVSVDGQLKLLDLGLARYLHHEETAGMTGTGQIMGTLDYAAPEQITGSSKVDVRSDIYSLGCTLYHLLTGHPPFGNQSTQTPFAKMTAQVSETPATLTTVLPNAPANLTTLLTSMLAKSPNQRPQSAKEVAQRLAEHTSQSDLTTLLDKARNQDPVALVPSKAAPATKPSKPATSPFFKRPIPFWIAIAAGFFGLILGAFLGIIITITKPDGSKITMKVPDGSSIDIQDPSTLASESPQQPTTQTAENQPSFQPQPITTVTPDMLSPMAFAVTVEPEDIAEDQLNEAITALRNFDGEGMLETSIGIWCPLDDSAIDVNVNATHDGQRYTLIRKDEDGLIVWKEITEQIGVTSSFQGGDQQLAMHFSDPLSDRMHDITKKNLLSHLAVIVDGEIIIAPKIVSPITKSAVLTGKFDRKKMQYLMQALSGLVWEDHIERKQERVVPQGVSLPEQDFDATENTDSWPSVPDLSIDLFKKVAPDLEIRANFERIGMALHQYHEVYGKLPASKNTYRPVELDEDDVPLDAEIKPYSWRVALLPYLGHEDLFAEYDFTQDWDSDHNRELLYQMPPVYRTKRFMEKVELRSICQTSIVGIDDARSAMGQPFHKIIDGTSNTLYALETDVGPYWTQPWDITLEEYVDTVCRSNCVQALKADGHYARIEKLQPKRLRELCIRDDSLPEKF